MPDTVATHAPPCLEIKIARPVKEPQNYHFTLHIKHPDGTRMKRSFGIRDAGFVIPHHEIWDSFFPLMYLSRNGGPLFNKAVTRARVRAEYPLHRKVAAFFAQRAKNFGLKLQVQGEQFDRTYEAATRGDMLMFGGGKDSRLLLGTLREIGQDPVVICAQGARYARDLPKALCFETYDFSMPNRIVPALMHLPRRVYQGCGLGEVHLHMPWHQHFDISAPEALDATSALLQSLGFDISIIGPQAVLPYNLTQKILMRRYPILASGQISVHPHKASEKNLHVSLLKRYHGITTQDHCSEELFTQMLQPFVARALDRAVVPFGHNANREVIEREMRAIIFRLICHGRLTLNDGIALPDSWNAPWIDFIHAWRVPALSPDLLAIYRQYADIWPAEAQGLPACLEDLRKAPAKAAGGGRLMQIA